MLPELQRKLCVTCLETRALTQSGKSSDDRALLKEERYENSDSWRYWSDGYSCQSPACANGTPGSGH